MTKTIAVSLGYNQVPPRRDTVVLPGGVSCNAKQQIVVPKGTTFPYLLGSNAPQCSPNGNGTTTIDYGGIASPYTDSYSTDPLFTTSMIQGIVDRRAAGSGVKIAATYTSPDKRLVLLVSRAFWDYGTLGAPQQTDETDADAMYHFSAMRPHEPYKGLLARYRYGVRDQTDVAVYGGLPLFKYNRAQIEYDF